MQIGIATQKIMQEIRTIINSEDAQTNAVAMSSTENTHFMLEDDRNSNAKDF